MIPQKCKQDAKFFRSNHPTEKDILNETAVKLSAVCVYRVTLQRVNDQRGQSRNTCHKKATNCGV